MEDTDESVSWDNTTEEEKVEEVNENHNPYISAKKKLHLSFLPSEMVGRETQFIKIKTYLLDCIKNQKPGSVYISGVPGTGKTATFDSVVESIMRQHKDKFKYISFNYVGFNTTKAFYTAMANLLCPQIKAINKMKQEKLLEKVESYISKSHCIILLKIDEIDQIQTLELLYRVFNWPNLPNSKLILVGIANEITLTDKLPRLKLYKVLPLLVPFDAYNKQQIANIIHDRLSDHTNLFDLKAIDYIASKATTSGDIRKALDISIKALDVVHEKYERLYANDSTCPVVPIKIGDVASIVRNTMSSKEIDTIKALPFHQRLILCCMVKLAKDREVELQSVLEKYRQISTSEDLPSVRTAEFLDMCQLIATTELVALKCTEKKQKNAPTNLSCRTMKVEVRVSEEDLIFAVSGETLLSNIMTPRL